MAFSYRVPVLSLALFALLVAVPAAASDGTSAQVQVTVATDGCSGSSAALAPLLAPESAPAWWTGSRPAGDLASQEPIAQQGPPNRRGYCKCGCGITCQTDADCGPGGSCVGFISCC